MKIAPMLMVLALAGSLRAKPVIDTENAFAEYHLGKPVAVEEGRATRSLGETVESGSYTTREILRVLQLAEEGNRKDGIPHLEKLHEIHHAESFAVIYGDQARFVKARDVDGDICRIIEGVILRLDFENRIRQIDLSPSADVRPAFAPLRNSATKELAGLLQKKVGKDSPEAIAVSGRVRATLDKLDSVIEEDYKEQPGSANVFPPHGTPNAAAGMSPDAISDPELKRQYLATIENEKKKQWKNSQQHEARLARREILRRISSLDAFQKDELINLFTNEGKSRELLRKMISPG